MCVCLFDYTLDLIRLDKIRLDSIHSTMPLHRMHDEYGLYVVSYRFPLCALLADNTCCAPKESLMCKKNNMKSSPSAHPLKNTLHSAL